ncbi:hypothetical protein, partial [Methanoculleus chikugoensis]|uniref:hypothetical protein n=1 Tax=Methanoculleus chikugoensis TaxID=118126 RepID=UPI001FB50BD3
GSRAGRSAVSCPGRTRPPAGLIDMEVEAAGTPARYLEEVAEEVCGDDKGGRIYENAASGVP